MGKTGKHLKALMLDIKPRCTQNCTEYLSNVTAHCLHYTTLEDFPNELLKT